METRNDPPANINKYAAIRARFGRERIIIVQKFNLVVATARPSRLSLSLPAIIAVFVRITCR